MNDHICVTLEAADVEVCGTADKVAAFLTSLPPRLAKTREEPRDVKEEIRQKHGDGATVPQLAEEYDIGTADVGAILLGVTYTDPDDFS